MKNNDLYVRDVVDLYLNGQSALARALGISPQAVQQWCDNDRVPIEHLYNIAELLYMRDTHCDVSLQTLTPINLTKLKEALRYL